MEFFFTKLLEICNTHDKKLQTHQSSEEHSPLSGIIVYIWQTMECYNYVLNKQLSAQSVEYNVQKVQGHVNKTEQLLYTQEQNQIHTINGSNCNKT